MKKNENTEKSNFKMIVGIGLLALASFAFAAYTSRPDKRFNYWANNFFFRLMLNDSPLTLDSIYENYLSVHKMFDCDDILPKKEFRKKVERYFDKNSIKYSRTKTPKVDGEKTTFVFEYTFIDQ